MDGDSQISNISQYSASNQKITINGWTENHEEIFYEWADKAMCYRWLHSRSFNIYSLIIKCSQIGCILSLKLNQK